MHSLKSLSDKDLLNRLVKLVRQEHEFTLEILLHIIEVEDRRIYRSLGYSSMFVYCTERLGYSESSTNRRIYAARAVRKCPKAYDYLYEGSVNLATLALVWKHITPKLLEEIRNKTYRQVLAIVSRFNPMIKHWDVTRPVVVRKPVTSTDERQIAGANSKSSSDLSLDAGSTNAELGEISLRRGGKKSANVDTSTPPKTEAVKRGVPGAIKTERVGMHQVNCLLDNEVMQKLDRCKELLSGKYPCGMDLNTLLSELAATWLEKNDPIMRGNRREQSKKSRVPRRADQKKPSRYISAATRNAVYKRDGGRCTYIGSSGKRCNSKWDMEIHHDRVPFALGGSHSTSNLKLLCAAHNKLEAERIYGKDHADKLYRKIE